MLKESRPPSSVLRPMTNRNNDDWKIPLRARLDARRVADFAVLRVSLLSSYLSSPFLVAVVAVRGVLKVLIFQSTHADTDHLARLERSRQVSLCTG